MRIDRIDVQGFGSLSDQQYDLKRPITLFYGPNEAGKSTLLAFIRSVLFGIPNRSNMKERYEPLKSSLHGGMLVLCDEEGDKLTVKRIGRNLEGSKRESTPDVYWEDGTPAPSSELRRWMGGVSAEVFKHIFAFGLDELQDLRTLQSDEVNSYIYSAGMGMHGNSVMQAEKSMTLEMDKLFKPRGRNQDVYTSLQKLHKLEQELRQSKHQVGEYNQLSRELEQLEQGLRENQQQLAEIRRDKELAAKGIELWDAWFRREFLLLELQDIPKRVHFPEQSLTRYEKMKDDLHRITDEYELKQKKLGELTHHHAKTAEQLDFDLVDKQQLISDLYEQLPEVQKKKQMINELRQETSHDGAQLQQLLRQVSESWDEEQLERFPVTYQMKDQLRSYRDELSELKSRQAQLEQAYAQATSQITEKTSDLNLLQNERDALQPVGLSEQLGLPEGSIALTLEAIEQVVDSKEKRIYNERELQASRERLEALQYQLHREERLVEKHKRLQEQLQSLKMEEKSKLQSRDRRFKIGLALGTMLSFLISAYLWMQGEVIGAVSVFTFMIGASGIAGWFLSRKRRVDNKNDGSKFAVGTLDQIENESVNDALSVITELNDRIEKEQQKYSELMRHMDTDLAKLHVLVGEKEAAAASPSDQLDLPSLIEGRSSELSSFVRARNELRQALNQEQFLCKQISQVKVEIDQLEQHLLTVQEDIDIVRKQQADWTIRWGEWLAKEHIRLSEQLKPEHVLDLVPLIERGKELLFSCKQKKQKLNQLIKECSAFEDKVKTVSSEDYASQDVLYTVRRMKEQLDLSRQIELDVIYFMKQIHALEDELKQLHNIQNSKQQDIRELWRLAEAENESQFLEHARDAQRTAKLEEELRQINIQMKAWQGSFENTAFQELFHRYDLNQLKERLAQLEQEEQAIQILLNDQLEQRGRLNNELERLQQEEHHAIQLLQLEEASARLQAVAKSWGVRALAVSLIRQARDVYERERQPGVIVKASEMFEQLTTGAYTKVMSPLGEKTIRVRSRDSAWMEPAMLSKGTREQLYLSMRFALVEAFANARGVTLPLVMDDIFVNFDSRRLSQSIEVLNNMSKQHQIIMFTCHEHVRDLVERAAQNPQIIYL